MHNSALSISLLWNVKKSVIFFYWDFFFFQLYSESSCRTQGKKRQFFLLFANICSKAPFHNIWHFQGQAIVVDRNLLQLAKSVFQFLENSFPLSNKTMDTTRCSFWFVMSIQRVMGGKILNPRWQQMCEMFAEHTVWISVITFTQTKEQESEKNNE